MESAAYIWCRILQELQNSREIAQSEPLWESAEPICAENGVFALYIADREQRSLFLERFFDETERILHDTLNSELQLELWDDEKTAAFRSDPMVVARINPQYTGENFVVTQENAAAFDAAMRWAEQADAPLLYIYPHVVGNSVGPPAELYSGRPGLNCYCAPATGSSMR